jgi:hypothetical protein
MNRHLTPSVLAVTLLLCGSQLSFAATQLATNTLGELTATDANGKIIKSLAQGSVGEIVRDGKASFKVSYGKDLQGNCTAIIYADPANPQPINLTYQDKNIVISKEAVLTIILDGNGAILQSGVLGQVKVANEAMKPSSNLRISKSGTVMAATTPITPVQIPANGKNLSAAAETTSQIVVSNVTGKVFVSQDNGAEAPMNDLSQLKVGSTIRTGDNGNVALHLFPSTTTTLYKNSTLTIKEYSFTNGNGSIDRRFVGVLSKGKVLNNLDVKGKGTTFYQVQTPHQSFTAMGTNFLVTVNDTSSDSSIQVYQGVVTASDGSQIHPGIQALFAANNQPQYRAMNDTDFRQAEDRSRSYGNEDGKQQYLQAYKNPALEDAINKAQNPFQPRLNPDPITPVAP